MTAYGPYPLCSNGEFAGSYGETPTSVLQIDGRQYYCEKSRSGTTGISLPKGEDRFFRRHRKNLIEGAPKNAIPTKIDRIIAWSLDTDAPLR